MRPLHYYLSGTGCWFLAYGIQSVTFAWLVTIVLHAPPDLVGIAQMALLLPATILMLVGGSLADHFGGKPMAVMAQAASALGPLFLVIMLLTDNLTYPAILVFAVYVGCIQALVTPARDGLLAAISDGRLQRRVMQVSMIQFGLQMVGFVIASNADTLGAVVILGIQAVILLGGAVLLSRLKVPPHPPAAVTNKRMVVTLMHSIADGYRTVASSPPMRAVALQNVAMGIFFMGTYIVTVPVLVRDIYAGSSAELSWLNAANSLGVVLMIIGLYRYGDVIRQGRALLVTQLAGAVALMTLGFGFSFYALAVCVFAWGMCGGVTMTMSRTIMQEHAPPDQRARTMAFYSFSFMGAGPVGALFNGYLVDGVGPQMAVMISSGLMFIVVLGIASRSSLWHLRSPHERILTS